MKRIGILVEGHTENEFVRDILAVYLQQKEIYIDARMVTTNRRGGFKGGITSYEKVRKDIHLMIHNFDMLTTFIDFYGLKHDFPGMGTLPTTDCYQQVQHVEEAFHADVIRHTERSNFIPYLALHEFEAMLLAFPDEVQKNILNASDEQHQQLQRIIDRVNSPEEINLQNPPSKRLKTIFTRYDKVNDGLLIAVDIGIDRIRSVCPHFDQWLQKLETI